MKLNHALFSKGFSNQNGKWVVTKLPREIDTNYSSEKYCEYLSLISRYYTYGKKWTEKFKGYCDFLCLDIISLPSTVDIAEKLDYLYELRNDIAHLNRHYNCPPTLRTASGFKFSRETELDTESFRDVITYLIDIMNDAIRLLEQSDLEVHEKWPMQRCNPSEEYASVVSKITKNKA